MIFLSKTWKKKFKLSQSTCLKSGGQPYHGEAVDDKKDDGKDDGYDDSDNEKEGSSDQPLTDAEEQ